MTTMTKAGRKDLETIRRDICLEIEDFLYAGLTMTKSRIIFESRYVRIEDFLYARLTMTKEQMKHLNFETRYMS